MSNGEDASGCGCLVLPVVAIAAWFVFGNPSKTIAGWLWPEDAAPWEEVDAYYYPSRENLTVHQASRDVGSVEDCRRWVYATAASNGDPNMMRGDFECGVGRLESEMGFNVYRITVR